VAVDLTIQLSPAHEAGVQRSAIVKHLNQTYGVQFHPVSSKQEYLSGFFHADVPEERAYSLAGLLRNLPEIRAAYVKPAGEPPG